MTQFTKPWLVFMAGPNSLQDIHEMYEPIKTFVRGICATYHGDVKDSEAQYLETNKGDGRIVYIPFVGRHDHSRNCYLYSGKIEQGDWCLQTDVLEWPSPIFLFHLSSFLDKWTKQGVNAIYYYGKPFLFQYHESMRYSGTPHERLDRLDGQMRVVEVSGLYPNEEDVRLNVRPRKRNKTEWISHYARYSLYPWGSNHYALGLENNPRAQELFAERETARVRFLDLLRELGLPRNVDVLIEYMKKGEMDERFIRHVESDKNWSDVYRFYVLGDETVRDDHSWENLVKIPRKSC